MLKLRTRYAFKSLTINASEISTAKMIKVIQVYFNTENVADISNLKNKSDAWTLAKSMTVPRARKVIEINFPVPFSATNLLIKFDSFYESDGLFAIFNFFFFDNFPCFFFTFSNNYFCRT